MQRRMPGCIHIRSPALRILYTISRIHTFGFSLHTHIIPSHGVNYIYIVYVCLQECRLPVAVE